MKTILYIVGAILLLVVIAGMITINFLATQSEQAVDNNTVVQMNPKNSTYIIDGEAVTLVEGISEQEIAPEVTAKVTTQYFGNEVIADLNNDGRQDVVFLLTQTAGGSATFFYVVAALNTEIGWVGSEGFLLGDRIAPQTVEMSQNPSHQNVVVVNYLTRETAQPMSEPPSVGQSVWLKLDSDSGQFGTVEQNFPGDANPDSMMLGMKQWEWVQTTYSNDTKVVPVQADAFTLTFIDDGTVTATTDCNGMNGTYEVDGNSITFGPMIMTEMFCPDSQEQAFASTLHEAQSFFFTAKGELVFDLKFDSGSATFR